MATLAERQAEEILANFHYREEQLELTKKIQEDLRRAKEEQVARIGEKIIEAASNTFGEIPEFKQAAVLATLPDFSNTRPQNDSIRFRLWAANIEVNFFPNDITRISRRFSLSMDENGARETFFLTTHMGVSKDDPDYRIKYALQTQGQTHKYYGAQAALKGRNMLRKIRVLGKS